VEFELGMGTVILVCFYYYFYLIYFLQTNSVDFCQLDDADAAMVFNLISLKKSSLSNKGILLLSLIVSSELLYHNFFLMIS
jgi:hypothetical protein